MTKVSANNGNEEKSDIFTCDIFRMTKVNPNNENEIKPDIFSLDISKSDIIFQWLQSISMTFVIGRSQFYSESEHKQVK